MIRERWLSMWKECGTRYKEITEVGKAQVMIIAGGVSG